MFVCGHAAAQLNVRENVPRDVALQNLKFCHQHVLRPALLEAEEKTKDEMATLRTDLMQRGSTAQQAHDQAWEMVREKYILLPSES